MSGKGSSPLPLRQWPFPSSLKQSIELHAHLITTNSLVHPPATAHLLRSLSSGQLNLYYLLRLRGAYPYANSTFTILFKACGLSMLPVLGEALHGGFVRFGGRYNCSVGNALIHMYSAFGLLGSACRVFDEVVQKNGVLWATLVGAFAKVGRMGDACKVFDEMPVKNVVAWTSLIAGSSQAGHSWESIERFKKMVWEGLMPDSVTMVSVLPACGRVRDCELGRWIHGFAITGGVEMTVNLVAALVDMYAKCGDMDSARRVFDSARWRVRPAWNTIIDGYCKMGDIGTAKALFEKMDDRDCISFNTMITGYVRNSCLREALSVFEELRKSGLDVDEYAMAGALTAYANLGALNLGKALHALIIMSNMIKFDIFLGTALVDMYAKCGRIDQALLLFDRMVNKDVSAWTAIISGLAMHGKGKLALDYFASMQEHDLQPNNVAYVAVLNACSHSGLVAEGRMHFDQMQSCFGIKPEMEHYGCMVDLLGRCGYLREAEEFIRSMPMEPNDVIWNSLLHACSIYKQVDLVEKVAKNMLDSGLCEDGVFVQLYNVYVNAGRWKNAIEVRKAMEQRGIRKIVGCSSIMVGSQIHKFTAGDRSHPEISEIEEMLREMVQRLSAIGYTPIALKVMEYMDEEEKGHYAFGHSERLAVAYGIMRLGTNLPVHVLKNLRICEDCHIAIKLIAKIYNRQIVVRDRTRFHHFHNGHCSCDDFW